MATPENGSSAEEPGQLLTFELLAQLEERLSDQGIDVLASVAPGLSDAQMNALVEPTGLALPAEARVWWAWHNDLGVAVAPTYYLITLETAVSEYHRLREAGREIAVHRATPEELRQQDIWWDRCWLPVLETGGRQVPALDSCPTNGAPSPVRIIDWERVSDEDYCTPIAPSLGELVNGWIVGLDQGVHIYDHVNGRWHHPDEPKH